MFLKTLTLKGFKSFADPTTIELEPGITVVVGPNGSGKSNVVDAVAWVLGAQGPKVVRSTKMDDVIFAGTSKRPALGRAEVSLTIDNSSRRLPVEMAEVTITRTLFRTGESEYAVNGAPCRLLDVQELLSDAGVGRQQHVIVSQGQLDSVLQSRPEDRRMVIEEAAGVLKFRRRRERAERRLESSEQNLLRLQDLQREVRRQLRPLERQAEAARRHDGLVTELRALRLHLAGREIDSLGRRLERARLSHVELTEREAGQRSELARLDDLVATTETAVSEAQAWDGSDRLGRAERLLERQRGLANVVVERRRTVAGLLAAATEADVVASLEAEASRLASELSAALAAAEALMPERDSLEALEAELRRDEAVFAGEAVPTGLASARNARQQHEAARDRLSAAREAVARLAERLASVDRMREEHEALLADLAVTAAASEANHEQLRANHERLAAAERAAAGARRRASPGPGRPRITRTLSRPGWRRFRPRSTRRGREPVSSGWPGLPACSARSPTSSRSTTAARRASRPPWKMRSARSWWTGRPPPATRCATCATPACTVACWRQAGRAGRAGPSRCRRPRRPSPCVTAFDQACGASMRCSTSSSPACSCAGAGWRRRSASPRTCPATRSSRRQAIASRFGAGASGQRARERRGPPSKQSGATPSPRSDSHGRRRPKQKRIGRRSPAPDRRVPKLPRRFDHAAAALAQAQSTRAQSAQRLVALAAERSDVSSAHEAAMGRLAATEAELVLREAELARAEGAELEALAVAEEATRARTALDERARSLAALGAELGMRAAGLEERATLLTTRRDEVERRLAGLDRARAEAAAKREGLEAAAVALGRLAGELARLGGVLAGAADRLRTERVERELAVATTAARLRQLRDERAATERDLAGARELLQRVELERAEAKLRLETAVEALRRELECEPDEAVASPCPELPPGIPAQARVRELDRELRLMGPVNPLALEELAALEERDRFLAEQLEDVRNARRELGGVIRAVDEEIVGVFAQAFADVARHFEELFAMLFPGGSGSLSLVEPEDLLSTGVEIEARPAGRNVRRLSLLSGGERSLVALAFLFAVFRSRPSPFYLMDEVEAALDDVNLHRFLDLVDEFRADAQLVIVTHQKRTMEAADVLYGVTMQPEGASKVVSERIGNPSAQRASVD